MSSERRDERHESYNSSIAEVAAVSLRVSGELKLLAKHQMNTPKVRDFSVQFTIMTSTF